MRQGKIIGGMGILGSIFSYSKMIVVASATSLTQTNTDKVDMSDPYNVASLVLMVAAIVIGIILVTIAKKNKKKMDESKRKEENEKEE
jgi:hypothetical protein